MSAPRKSSKSNENEENFLSTAQAAKRMGVTKETVRALCHDGLLANAIKKSTNGPWCIPETAVEAWINHPTYINSSNNEPVINPKTKQESLPWYRKISGVISILVSIVTIFTVISVIADFGPAAQQLANWGVYPWVRAEGAGEILVVISRFNYTEEVANTKIEREITRTIREEINKQGSAYRKLRIEVIPQKIDVDDKDTAENIGKKYNAHVVVWGEDTGIRVTVNFLHRKAYINWLFSETIPAGKNTTNIGSVLTPISDVENSQIGNPEGYSQFITSDLPKHMTYLSFVVIGQSLLGVDNKECIGTLQKGIEHYDPSNTELGSDAYYWLAMCYEASGQAEKALENFDKSLERNSNNPLAHIHSGALYWNLSNYATSYKHFDEGVSILEKGTLLSSDAFKNYPDLIAFAYLGRGMLGKILIEDQIERDHGEIDFINIKSNKPEYTYHQYVLDFLTNYSEELKASLNDLSIAEKYFKILLEKNKDGNKDSLTMISSGLLEIDYLKSSILLQMDQPQDAIQELESMKSNINFNEYNQDHNLWTAIAYESLGDKKSALDYYLNYYSWFSILFQMEPEKDLNAQNNITFPLDDLLKTIVYLGNS